MLTLTLTIALLGQTPSWKQVEQLVNDDRAEAASQVVEKRLVDARKAGDEAELARCLIKLTQLRIGLGGYETAVKRLRAEAWPKAPLHRAMVELYYANALQSYAQLYSWEIQSREKVDTKGEVDLKAWTRDQIYAEAQRAWQNVWALREPLGGQPVGALKEHLVPNDYPKGIRDTFRDAVTYMRVETLQNTAGWTAEQQNTTWRLDLAALIQGAPASSGKLDLLSPAVHPLLKVGALLDDLEAWHLEAGRREAALEARLKRLDALRAAYSEERPRAAVRDALLALLPQVATLGWSAVARAQLAQWWEDSGDSVRALAIARAGAQAFPHTLGGRQCAHLVARIEAPDFTLQGMQSDGLERRSLEVTHRNLPRLYLRAWRLDLRREITTRSDYQVLADRSTLKGLLARSADARWTVELPPTPDYRSHRTQVVPPLEQRGLWFIAASAREDFVEAKNRIVGVNLLLTRLVLATRQLAHDGSMTVSVVDGDTGAPVAGAQVQLWSYGYNRARRAEVTRTSDAQGELRLERQPGDRNYFLLAEKGGDFALEAERIGFWSSKPQPGSGALIFTDRSVFRPKQTVHWKVVAYRDVGQVPGTRYEVAAGADLEVQLYDPNHQVVEKAQLKTNRYGSAAGQFLVPAGRLLGQWQLRVKYGNRGGYAPLKVEEYKRPTFEAKLVDSAAPARLNTPVTLKGEVRYYFGLPVAAGQVRYRVRRTPSYPWWWWWEAPSAREQTVATGDAKLLPDGTFSFTFTPEADPSLAREVTYTYSVDADVTDEGGETRSASKVFRLGQVSVEARADLGADFFVAGQGGQIALRRTDLDGNGRAGAGSWRIVALVQPNKPLLPADEPVALPPQKKARHQTPGDLVRPRWAPGYSSLGSLRSFADGAELARGEVTHAASGAATLSLPALAAGPYRLRYTTKDEFGSPYEMWKDFLVAGPAGGFALPAVFKVERAQARVGESVRVFAYSGFLGQKVRFEVFRDGQRVHQKWLEAGKDAALFEWPVKAEDRGGFALALTMVRDHQAISWQSSVRVPWDDKELKVELATFRDTLRPGAKETFRVTVKGKEGALGAGAAEVLAYMYDQSLDVFGPHHAPSVPALYAWRGNAPWLNHSLGYAGVHWLSNSTWFELPPFPTVHGDALMRVDGYGLGGFGGRRNGYSRSRREAVSDNGHPAEAEAASALADAPAAPPPPPGSAPARKMLKSFGGEADAVASKTPERPSEPEAAPVQVRSNFAETAFFAPALLTDGKGGVAIEFEVPDSVTAWNVWAHAVTRDLRGGSLQAKTRSVKELMVRPYLPRFLREGDRAALKVVINNASDKDLAGELKLELVDPETHSSVAAEFGLPPQVPVQRFSAKAKEGATLTFPLVAPKRVGLVAFKVVARAGDLSDGEQRPLPLLPSRMHLSQSKFATLKDKDLRTLELPDLASSADPTRLHEQLVVTVDAQLFYSVLNALPYLARFPYECTEQTLNRFVSTAIVSSVFRDYPQVAKMAEKLAARREGPLETFDALDPNRKLALEESPWLIEAKGGKDPLGDDEAIAVLNPKVAEAERASALAKLKKAQYPDGAFPWWPGGPASPYMTLYILSGLSRAAEFKSPVPEDMVRSGWRYASGWYRSHWKRCLATDDCGFEFITWVNFLASSYPDPVLYTGLSKAERDEMLAFSFRHWRKLAPIAKGHLALTLTRADRPADAQKVFASVMDSAKTTRDEGTFWQPEDKAWLWYHDTIDSHAFALRVMTELSPKDDRRAGLVQWLLLNKKLNHWKSTRATAEVIYSLTKYLEADHALGVREESRVELGPMSKTFVFEPTEYTGKKNQLVVPGAEIVPAMSKVTVSKDTKGFQFAQVTWHYSTDQLPKEGRGDLFQVERAWFRREKRGAEVTLQPIAPGVKLEPGDELEVQLSIRSRAPAEYVHLKDPRAAGLEPDRPVSRYNHGTGIGWYEEYRDSATNFFFESVPAGQFTFKYRLRAAMGGTFRVGPATLQSMYAPEFTAFSAGHVVDIATGGQ